MIGVAAEVVVMIGFGGVELAERHDLGDDRVAKIALVFEVLNDFDGCGFLLRAVIKND